MAKKAQLVQRGVLPRFTPTLGPARTVSDLRENECEFGRHVRPGADDLRLFFLEVFRCR